MDDLTHKYSEGDLVEVRMGSNDGLPGVVLKTCFGDELAVEDPGRSSFSNIHEPIYRIGIRTDVYRVYPDGDYDWADWFRECELRDVNVLDALSQRMWVEDMIRYVEGDATTPQGEGPKAVVHVCNNVGAWGAGFVLAISRRWKEPEAAYRSWAASDLEFGLGRIQPVQVEQEPNDPIWVINMVAQHGIGSANGPAIRYHELKTCLRKVAAFAKKNHATVHMPRIGCGLAGGRWELVEPIIRETLTCAGIITTVYDFVG